MSTTQKPSGNLAATTATHQGKTYLVTTDQRTGTNRGSKSLKALAHVSGCHDLAELPAPGSGEAAWDAYAAAVRKAQRHFLEAAVPDAKWSYSAKAGCSCGCSPGFTTKDLPAQTLYVSVHPA